MAQRNRKDLPSDPGASVITVKNSGGDPRMQIAKEVSRPETLAAGAISSFANFYPELDINCLIKLLKESLSLIHI